MLKIMYNNYKTSAISIFAQINITNPASNIGQIWRIYKLLYSPTGEYNKTKTGG
jgi:hypothetical protein